MKLTVLQTLCPGPVIPAARTIEDLRLAFACQAPGIMLLFGDINTLPGVLSEASRHHKKLIVHLDLLEGVGKDRAGVRCLARMGVPALITTKSQLVKAAREDGLVVIQRLFMMDSDTLRNGIKIIRNVKPDAIEILPASVPPFVFQELAREVQLPILAGGLVNTQQDVQQALANGASAVSTSSAQLWE